MIKSIKTIEFFGNINDTVNVSGVQTFGDLLLLVTDEKNTIPVLKKIGDDSQYKLIHYLALQDDDEDEKEVEDEFDMDRVPTSLEDLKKLKDQLRKKYNGEVDIESYFGSSTR